MKAETRKQLETNSLAEGINRLMHGGGKAPNVIWVLLGVAVVVGVLYWWLTSSISAKAGDAWSRLWQQQQLGIMGAAEGDLKNTAAALGADLYAADAELEVAQVLSPSSDPRASQQKYENAAAKYLAVADRAGGVPEVRLRALVGAAKCRETLGDLDQALAIYKRAVMTGEEAKLDQHPLLAEAKRKVALLGDPKGEGREFYTGWPGRLPKADFATDRPTAPPSPNFPPLVDPFGSGPIATTPGSFTPPTMTAPAATAPNTAPPSPTMTTPTRPSKPESTKPASTAPASTAPASTAPSKPAETKPAK